ncbi:MAG: hypothetical protein COB78_05740 [Hyphomicrobiales bacterium]|nr:MAG: hypothetical protein COB78_05740 [Hyphomicrobiales bacterium]
MEKLLCHFVQQLPATEGEAPEWIQLIPAGEFTGDDGRGPFTADLQAVVEASSHNKMAIDENHSTELLAVKGEPSPARGWIVEMQARDDGVWGRVEWTEDGERLVKSRSYGFVSPVFMHTRKRPYRVSRITSVALVNSPNLTSLKSLHRKNDPMDEELLKLLGLEAGADDAAVATAVKALNARAAEHDESLGAIVEALEINEGASSEDMVAAINSRSITPAGGEDSSLVKGLQDQIKLMNSRLTTISDSAAKDKAVHFVDAAIADCKLVPSLRDHMISRHMKNPADVETEIGAMISLNSGGLTERKIDDTSTISAVDDQVCAQMGLDPKAFAETSKAIRSAH